MRLFEDAKALLGLPVPKPNLQAVPGMYGSTLIDAALFARKIQRNCGSTVERPRKTKECIALVNGWLTDDLICVRALPNRHLLPVRERGSIF